ncbi:DNA topoisomerase domain protein [Bacillus sp. OxB-1]|uniref:hypothetical protein n=1 Tax=Bacillus sp. (strain OxB-1) TaxID=98228 RepID=UPI000581EEF9|nr:hypothetical protein [Bacillus sp. OxB-1]BAQ11471.1 DNA topoisomerase domain protein [Bacillus sp. OxB-1]
MNLNNREETITLLKELNEKGYQYVVRDEDMPYLCCFSLKPKKYLDINGWGYIDPDAPKAMMAYAIKNTDITEISWSNRSATSITDFLVGA